MTVPNLPDQQQTQTCIVSSLTRVHSACRTRAAGGVGDARHTWPEQRQTEGVSALRSRSGDKRRHTAYVISTTGAARPVSLVAKRRDGSKSVPFSRSELERLIDPHKGARAAGLQMHSRAAERVVIQH